MDKLKLAAIAQAAVMTAAVGCTMPTFRKGYDAGQPMVGSRPGPVKQLATSVSESSFGRSVSKAFDFSARKKAKALRSDPTSLANKPSPPTADDYVKLGESADREGDTEGARQHYHKALDMEPHHLGALLGLGRLFDRQGQLDRASAHYAEATNFHPRSATAFNDLGLCLARQGRYNEAITALHRAIEINPDKTLYRNNIATVLVAEGRIDEALAHLTDAHGPAVAHYNIGYLLNKQGRRDQALQQFQLALQDEPSMTPAREWIEALSSPDFAPNGAAALAAAVPDLPQPRAVTAHGATTSVTAHGATTSVTAHGATAAAPGAPSYTPVTPSYTGGELSNQSPADPGYAGPAPNYEPGGGAPGYESASQAAASRPSGINVVEVPRDGWDSSRRGAGQPAATVRGSTPLEARRPSTSRY